MGQVMKPKKSIAELDELDRKLKAARRAAPVPTMADFYRLSRRSSSESQTVEPSLVAESGATGLSSSWLDVYAHHDEPPAFPNIFAAVEAYRAAITATIAAGRIAGVPLDTVLDIAHKEYEK